jgi:hypothetical protein
LIQKELTKEQLLEIMLHYKGTIQKSYDYFMGLRNQKKDSEKSINGLIIDGK